MADSDSDELVFSDEEGNVNEGGVVEEQEEQPVVPFNPLSMEDVANRCSDFSSVRSMLEVAVEDGGKLEHLLMLSPKYHAELAGQGIEYDFGRCKWWFRNHNSHSTAGLKVKSLESMSKENVTIGLTRKYARRARDYMRAYRWGAKGLEVEVQKKVYKCHRSSYDQFRKFIAAAEVIDVED